MYFQIDNTPEHVRRARRREVLPNDSPIEECPRLILAPFSRPPKIVFENILIGSIAERFLEVYNPSKQLQQVTFLNSLPGLVIQLPDQWLQLEPETCYSVKLTWMPTQPTAVRETIHVTNENRGRFDIVIVLKSVMNIKGKGAHSKGFKISPGKIKKKSGKKSPVTIYKKKPDIIYNSTQIMKNNSTLTSYINSQISNKENVSSKDNYISKHTEKCPFDSISSVDIHFNTSEIFGNIKRPEVLQQTFDKTCSRKNVLKPINKNDHDSVAELFDNITLTPFKFASSNMEKLDKAPKIILTLNSESDFDDSLDLKYGDNKKNETHSNFGTTSSQSTNKWATNHDTQTDYQLQMETPIVLPKKHPNTSSPKEFNSPNFSINTEFSRISDLSFHPQRFSTERKCLSKLNNETQDIIEDPNKLNSDTFTKESPNAPIEPNFDLNQMYDMKPPHYFMKSQMKMCRQALFKENMFQKEFFEHKYVPDSYEHNVWCNDLRLDTRSPPRSITPPPLQSITEESVQFSDTHVLDKTDVHKKTFTIDQTFDKTNDNFTTAYINKQTWSKKAIRTEHDLWKIPITHVKKSAKKKQAKNKDAQLVERLSNITFGMNKTSIQNMTINQIGNVYSQSSTIDPFISSTYFYDAEAVEKFETEFKRWLNYILTPPADLDSNIEQKIDVGKAWIENRNKDVPVAPTKEQVSSAYHNSYRLERVRRSARTLFMSSEMVHVFQKLILQIDKKLIAIRTDRNLHLDVGLQKIILELLLSYNPLWLRIGLETIYGIVLPLKSNSDIEGLTIFIIQRMFKNPFLKNKNSQSKAPNMLLPAYLEAIKKFTLKKFFMLVYFLDQAKQRKLISHDPCLFCRNAVCKESREIIIRFTREVIAGIGDITKHLRPLGYVVSQKQSYLDEYKYAVHNIALDIRDGVRLTKIMEIILIKDGLLSQLRTPAISRLQKIHNVQVALNALKEANFVIHGDITASDIADGHREKTLSLLWQIIHVFRAPLFDKAANVIQTWWRKKYEVIVKIKLEKERLLQERHNAASLIQCWWRRIQYNRLVEWELHKVTTAAIVIQKYCRMWLCRTRLLKLTKSVLKIENWYRSVKLMQKHRADFLLLKRCAINVQRKYRTHLIIKTLSEEHRKLQATITIQRRYRAQIKMRKERDTYFKLKSSCVKIQRIYRALRLGRHQRQDFLQKKWAAIKIQRWFRSHKIAKESKEQFQLYKYACVTIQTAYKARIIGRKQRQEYIRIRTATIIIQQYFRSYILTKTTREHFIRLKTSTVVIQRYYRSHLEMKAQREMFIQMKRAALLISAYYKRYKETKLIRQRYCQLRKACVYLQKRYQSIIAMKAERKKFVEFKTSIIYIQTKYRAFVAMSIARQEYLQMRLATITIQRRFRALRLMKQTRMQYIAQLSACRCIQRYYRCYVKSKRQKAEYLKLKQATIVIQRKYRGLITMRRTRIEYIQTRTAAVIIQRRYRSYCLMLKERHAYIKIVNACCMIQLAFRAYLLGKLKKQEFNSLKRAVVLIQTRYRLLRETRKIYNDYQNLKSAVLFIQRRYRTNKNLQSLKQNGAARKIQLWYRDIRKRNVCRNKYLKIRNAVILIQSLVRKHIICKRFIKIRSATLTIQNYYRNYKLMTLEKQRYLKTRWAIVRLQSYVRSFIARRRFLKLRSAVLTIQAIYRLKKDKQKRQQQKHNAAICLQKYTRRYVARVKYLQFMQKVIYIQRLWRGKLLTRFIQCQYQQKRSIIIKIQSVIRGYLVRKYVQANREHIQHVKEESKRHWAASKIQAYCRGHIVRVNMAYDNRVTELRHRWRNGNLNSSQDTMRQRHEEAMDVLFNLRHINAVIQAFKSLELLTEVFPMMYKDNVSAVVNKVYLYMLGTNRSISNVELLKYAAAVLVNLTRYKVTGPYVYSRDRIQPILKFMWRYSNSETKLFCMMATYLWLFSKYEDVKQDLMEVLNQPENHRILVTTKYNIDRAKRMAANILKNKHNTPNSKSFYYGDTSMILPTLEPDYGIIRVDEPRYFVEVQHAIDSLFHTYKL